MERLMLTVSEVADCLHISRNKVYELLYSGALTSAKIGAARRIPVAALREFVTASTDPDRLP